MPKKVLLVDGESDVLRYFRMLLEGNGYRVSTAEHGAEAMRKIRGDRPDLVTLDLSLPYESGIPVYRGIKVNDDLRNIPVLIITGAQREIRQLISERKQIPPPDGYLQKPVALGDVLSEVRRLIG